MKVRGFGDPVGRRTLARHIATYILAFLPALVWIGRLHDCASIAVDQTFHIICLLGAALVAAI
jgi:hypothetical protein